MNILIDSSVWIPFLRGRAELPDEVVKAMTEGRARLCHIVWLEIYRGARGKREEKLVEDISEFTPNLPMDDETFSLTAKLGRAAIRSGINCPLADVMVVACAQRHGATLIYDDKHMDALLAL